MSPGPDHAPERVEEQTGGPLRITVRGGDPSPPEVAALSAAVLALAASAAEPQPVRPPAWAVAARLEATGVAPLRSAADPRLATRP